MSVKSRDPSSSITTPSSSTVARETPSTPRNSNSAGEYKIDEVIAILEKTTLRRAESLVNERLAAATQAHELTTQMLNDATAALGNSTKLLNSGQELMRSLEQGLETSALMQNRLESDIANIKGSAVSALSIFVSFFAFITVSINVFSKAGSVVSAAALVLVFWSLLVGFNVIIGWQFGTLKNTGLAWFLLMIVSFLSVLSIVGMFHFSPEVLAARMPIAPPSP